MSKYNKTIEVLNERAMRLGEAIKNKRMFIPYVGFGELEECYRITHTEKEASLYHWRTLTATVNLTENKLTYVCGESASDADSIATFILLNGVNNIDCGFRPVNGGFYVVNAETKETLFLDNGLEKLLQAI